MRIIFFGTPDFVDPVLKTLEENFDVILAVRKPEQFNNLAIKRLQELKPDLFVVASFGKILSKEILDIPKLGAINIHPSLLPKYRGPSPIQTAILNGDKNTGVTIIKMDEKVDHGPILFQTEEEILESDTFETLAKKLFAKAAENLPNTISNYELMPTNVTKQDDSKPTFTKLLTRESGLIDMYNLPDKQTLELMIKAYHPWPGVWTKTSINDKLLTIKLLPEQKIQVEGKKPMNYKDFVNGYPSGKIFLQKLNLL